MKMTKGWPAHKRPNKIVRIKDNRSIPWKTLGLTDPIEEQKSKSMDEIRQQVLMMSYQEIGEGLHEIEPEEPQELQNPASPTATQRKSRIRRIEKEASSSR